MSGECDKCGEHCLDCKCGTKTLGDQILDSCCFLDSDGKKISGKNSQWVQWINVKDRRPTKDDSPILAKAKDWGDPDILRVAALHWLDDDSRRGGGEGWYDHSDEYGIKENKMEWWMPLPQLPKEL